jgi:hypothetical protein
MKQYTMRITDSISCDIALQKVPFFRRMLMTENVNTYVHKRVDDDINIMKNG